MIHFTIFVIRDEIKYSIAYKCAIGWISEFYFVKCGGHHLTKMIPSSFFHHQSLLQPIQESQSRLFGKGMEILPTDLTKKLNYCSKLIRRGQFSWGQDQASKIAEGLEAQTRTVVTICNLFSYFLKGKHYLACSTGAQTSKHNPCPHLTLWRIRKLYSQLIFQVRNFLIGRKVSALFHDQKEKKFFSDSF